MKFWSHNLICSFFFFNILGIYSKGKQMKQRLFHRVYWPPVNDFQRSASQREPLQHVCAVACETMIFWGYKWKIRRTGVEGRGCLGTGLHWRVPPWDPLPLAGMSWGRVSSVVLKWWNLWSPSTKNKLRKKPGIEKSPSPGILTRALAELCGVGTALVSCSLRRRCLPVSTAPVIRAQAVGVQLGFKGSSHVSHLYINVFLIFYSLLVIIFYLSYFPLKVVIILYSCFSHYQLMWSFHGL